MYFVSSSDMQKHKSIKYKIKQIKQKLIVTLVISTIIVRSQDTLTYADMFIDLNNAIPFDMDGPTMKIKLKIKKKQRKEDE